jgi:hypothetical protein
MRRQFVQTGFSRSVSFSLTAVSMAVLASAASLAQAPASVETRAMILGPLQSEFQTSPMVAPRRLSNPYTLRFQASAPQIDARAVALARPAASRFAEAVLVSQSAAITRDGLSAFSAQEAVLASSASGSRLSVSMFQGDRPGIARLTYDPDYAETAGAALNPGWAPDNQRMALNYEGAFDTPGGVDGLDFGLSPRAGVSFGEVGPAATAGATVRLGQYLDGFENDRPAWWFFAGADRQAVLYDPGQGFDMRDALAMEPYAMVGDAQAGIAMRLHGADVSVAYIHRETRYELPQQAWETTEGFAAFSLTWRR